jgi:hypothetical protein
MSNTFDDLLRQAVSLPAPDKARLIAALAGQLAEAAERAPVDASATRERAMLPEVLETVRIFPNGRNPDTGAPLLALDENDLGLVERTGNPADVDAASRSRATHDRSVLGPIHGVNQDDLAAVGWAMIVSSAESVELLRGLTPLITHRARQQGLTLPPLAFRDGETCGAWRARHTSAVLTWPVPDDARPRLPVLLHHPGESATRWIERHGASLKPVDPALGVPYYLLIAGRPGPLNAIDRAFIPYEFQYQLDMFWGVGRLCFTELGGQHRLAAYTQYAERLVAIEERQTTRPAARVVYFGTAHPGDRATQASASGLIEPLHDGRRGGLSAAARYGFQQDLRLGQRARRSDLLAVLHGAGGERPALLVSATHGIGFPAGDARQTRYQGALVCQDWSGDGPIARDHYLAAEDLDDQLVLDGLIAVVFACYGIGCPHEDQFGWNLGASPQVIAPHPMIARLPQELLLRGALAVFGHVDRAWTYSFARRDGLASSAAQAAGAQVQAFEDVLRRLMDGKRLGFATDQFNAQQGALAVELSDLLAQTTGRSETPATQAELRVLWAARNDLRNYAVLGDPAARLVAG